MNPVEFTVLGTPTPAGSKKGFYNKHTGRVVITDMNEKKARPWKALVHDAAAQVMADPDGDRVYLPMLEGPVMVELTFWMPRPKGHFGSGANAARLKASAPRFHTTAPDALKLARGVEDAMQGLVYRNDSQIAIEHLQKVYGEPARCEVRVVPITQDLVEPQHREPHEAQQSATPAQLPLTALTEEAA